VKLTLPTGPWLMRSDALEALRAQVAALDIEARSFSFGGDEEPAPAADRPFVPGYEVLPEGVAVLSAFGPMLNRARGLDGLIAMLTGGTTYEWLGAGLRQAVADPDVKGIMLNLDTPGGIAMGVGELASAVRDAAKKKRCAAYIGGFGASAGYWLAAACPWIVAHETAFVGSIGSRIDMEVEERPAVKEYTFVSVQSPKKVLDPKTPEGKAQIQEWVDSSADLFIENVAKFRSTTPLRVMEDFGQGDVLVASEARKVGMVDEVGTFAETIKKLAAGATRSRVGPTARPMRAVAPGRVVTLTARS
jgi:capsid assembly protease